MSQFDVRAWLLAMPKEACRTSRALAPEGLSSAVETALRTHCYGTVETVPLRPPPEKFKLRHFQKIFLLDKTSVEPSNTEEPRLQRLIAPPP